MFATTESDVNLKQKKHGQNQPQDTKEAEYIILSYFVVL